MPETHGRKFPEGFYWGETRLHLVARPETLGVEAESRKFSGGKLFVTSNSKTV